MGRTGSRQDNAGAATRASEEEVVRLRAELAKAVEQRGVMADVLRIISQAPFELQRVLDLLTESAARLCEADMAGFTRLDSEGTGFRYVTTYNFPPDWLELVKGVRFNKERGSVVGRVLSSSEVVQVPDVLADPEFKYRSLAKMGGFRTFLGVPLLRDNEPIGVLVVGRGAVRPFSDKQIELLSTFADQAVVAIENLRMFEEIQDKNRQLEIADRYKSHFLASASHDLRQPLHALNLFVAQLRAETDIEKRDRLISRIDAAVESMNELFEALLDMSKLEAGILEPHPADFPISQLFAQIETTFSGAALEKDLRFRVVPSSAWVRTDFILLARIVFNLVSNAIRYTERGGVVVGCRRRGSQVRIDVCDSGPGIPRDQQSNIFQEFYQLAAAERCRRAGLGLGLAIVERLGRLLDHPVELDSRRDAGSRFSVAVPAALGGTTTAPSMGRAAAEAVRNKLVVVVDDDPVVLAAMEGILRSWGCAVVTGESGEAARAQLAGQARLPDLIISDYRLDGGRTGIEAIEFIREVAGRAVPAFLISGDTAPDALRAASAGGFRLLHKPVPPMALRAMLSRLL